MGGWCRTQTREEKGHQPSLPHYPKTHSTGATASHLMAAQSAIWFLQQESCGHCLRPGAGPSWGQGAQDYSTDADTRLPRKAPPATSHQKLWFCLFSSFCPQGSCPEGETRGLLPEVAEQLGLGDGRADANQRQCSGLGPKPPKSQRHRQERHWEAGTGMVPSCSTRGPNPT